MELCHDIDLVMACLRQTSQMLAGDPEIFFENDLYYAIADPLKMAVDFASYLLKNSRFSHLSHLISLQTLDKAAMS